MATSPVLYQLGQFPPRNLDWLRLVPLIGPANAGLARYDGLLLAIPNADVLLSPLTTQEAVLSSKIEGTNVTISEVLEVEAGAKSEALTQLKRLDAMEVLNYRRALQVCTHELENRSCSQHLLRSAHCILMEGVRGTDKSPGSYRKEQNWIGPKDCPIEAAHFVPVSPEHLQYAMDEWEQYLNRTDIPDLLVQLAILHVEFEAIHPFKDGNGRLGRMLIPLFLYQRKLLNSPDFYMSGYLEANREEYQERLRAVSRDGDWTGWCAFFLNGIIQQAAENERKARDILALRTSLMEKAVSLTNSPHAVRAVDFIFKNPIFSGSLFTNHSNMPRASASRILSLLRNEGVLRTISDGKAGRTGFYGFSDLLNIAEGRRVF